MWTHSHTRLTFTIHIYGRDRISDSETLVYSYYSFSHLWGSLFKPCCMDTFDSANTSIIIHLILLSLCNEQLPRPRPKTLCLRVSAAALLYGWMCLLFGLYAFFWYKCEQLVGTYSFRCASKFIHAIVAGFHVCVSCLSFQSETTAPRSSTPTTVTDILFSILYSYHF